MEAARRILHDEGEAEDAVQEALLLLWRWRERVNKDGNVESLLMRILHNDCINILHARQRRQIAQTPLEDLPSSAQRSLTALTLDPHASMEQKELEQQLQVTISYLPPRWQTILRMKFMDGLPNQQIAAILGISETATSSLLNRAKQALLQSFHKTTNNTN